MKYLPFILLFTSALSSFGQDRGNSQIRILDQYSYLLVGLKSANGKTTVYPLGTCFFARRETDLFLITSKHSINGYNTFTKMPTSAQFDTVGFKYFNKKTKKTSYSSLNIAPLKKWLSNDFFYESPDVVVLKMNDSMVEPYIHSIEQYLYEEPNHNEGLEKIIAFGYAVEEGVQFTEKTKSYYYQGQLADSAHIDASYPINERLYFSMQPKSIQGLSGSPTFAIYWSPRSKKLHILFSGVVFGKNEKYNSSYVVSPDIIRAQVKAFKGAPK